MVTQSPTLRIIMEGAQSLSGDGARDGPPTELERLRAENAALRKRLAQLTAQYIWAEGGNFGKIDSEIRQYGYKLDRLNPRDGREPSIVPL